MKTKVFDLRTIEGLRKAEQYKRRLENVNNRVIVISIGLDRVSIHGEN